MVTPMVVMVWQQMMFDPAPMRIARISGTACWPKCCSRRHWRADLYQRFISNMTTGLECVPMFDRTERQTSRRANRAANHHTSAGPGSFLFE